MIISGKPSTIILSVRPCVIILSETSHFFVSNASMLQPSTLHWEICATIALCHAYFLFP